MEHSCLSGFGSGEQDLEIVGAVLTVERTTQPRGAADLDVVHWWALVRLRAALAGHVRCVPASPTGGVASAVQTDDVVAEAGSAQQVHRDHRLRPQVRVAARVDHEETIFGPLHRGSRTGGPGSGAQTRSAITELRGCSEGNALQQWKVEWLDYGTMRITNDNRVLSITGTANGAKVVVAPFGNDDANRWSAIDNSWPADHGR